MPIKEIQRYAELRAKGDLTLNERMEMLTVHRESLNEQIQVLQEHMAKLDDKIDFYRQEIERTGLCRDNHAVSSRKRIDCQHTQARHTINEDSIITLFYLVDAGFQYAFTAYGVNEPYFQPRQFNVGREQVNALVMVQDASGNINGFIVNDVLHFYFHYFCFHYISRCHYHQMYGTM